MDGRAVRQEFFYFNNQLGIRQWLSKMPSLNFSRDESMSRFSPLPFPRTMSLLFPQSRWRAASLLLAGFVGLTMIDLTVPAAQAQQIRKLAHDYFFESITYNPQDPQHRSDLYRKQIGHAGRFYNCDNEECKRYSAYIEWKTNFQPQWVNTRGLVDGTVRDFSRVRQRIQNGSCNQPELPGIHTTNYKFRRASEFLMMDQGQTSGSPTLASRDKVESPAEASENSQAVAETSSDPPKDSEVVTKDPEDRAADKTLENDGEISRQASQEGASQKGDKVR